MGLPVVIVRGILESGKSTFIEESLKYKDFGDLGRTLIISQEQGEIEYDKEELKKCKADVVYLDSIDEWNDKHINDLIREYKPQAVFIEVNEMWEFDTLPMPMYFDVQQVMTIIDGTTFSAYFANMRQRFVDMIRSSEIVIINRCQPIPETSQMKRNVKMVNQNVAVLALNEKGEELKLESDLPYSLKEDVIKIELDDFGPFYIDTFENKDRYENRVVEFDCMAVFDRKLPPKSFIAGRLAMTCCVDDIQLMGHLCTYKESIQLENKSWIHLKAIIHYLNFRGAKEKQLIFELLEYKKIDTPTEDKALVMLN